MAFSLSVFTILLLSVVCNASNVPVFMWGDLAAPNLKSNPLSPTTSPALSDILSEELANDPYTVIFIEQTLSNEDFSRRDDKGETSYPYLHANIRKSVYLPSVENAMAAINLLEDPELHQVDLTEENLSQPIVSTGKFLIINLVDAKDGESRSELLRRHNDFMEKTMAALRDQYTSVVGVYTARQPSWSISHSRLRRQANANITTSDYVLDGLRLYAKNIELVEAGTTTILQGYTSANSVINTENQTMSTTLTFNTHSIALNFMGAGGYWYFQSVTLNPGTTNPEDLYPAQEIFALLGFAYRCGQNVSFVHENSTRHLFFEDLKVQPTFQTSNESSPVVFGDSFNCVGFFSAPIWSGLFVVFILLSIMFYGIIMMMDIRTMDRFDDPKGKTITINAGE